jgi:hypothetical protein
MKPRLIKLVVAVSAVLVLALGGATWAVAGGGDDEGPSATGPGADRARTAALAHLGGGTANSIERDSEDGAVWEVEVTKANGETVDVRLDASYGIVTVESDSEHNDGNENENEK